MILSKEVLLGVLLMILFAYVLLIICFVVTFIMIPKETKSGILCIICAYGFYMINISNKTKIGIILFWTGVECAKIAIS